MPIAPLRRRAALVALALTFGLTAVGALGAAPASAGDPGYCATEERNFVCDTYESFLRRTPSDSETGYWKDFLPEKKTFFLAHIGRTAESRRRMIEAYYGYFAETEPDAGSLTYWEGEVLKPNGFRRLEAALLGSYVGMIDGFLDRAFHTLLDRSPSEAESTYWGTRVTQTSRNLVAADLAYTLEARRIRVRWTFQNELGYFPDTASRDYWAERLRTGTSFLDLRIGLKAAPDAYPIGSAYCSPLAPFLTNNCFA